MSKPGNSAASDLRVLPSVDEILRTPEAARISAAAGELRLVEITRSALETRRRQVLAGDQQLADSREAVLAEILQTIDSVWNAERGRRTRRVINAAGVVIHTNLGRAPLSAAASRAVATEAAGYCTVEYDLESGTRGRRGDRCEQLFSRLTGAESSIIVNNCAAAAFLILSVLARGREVVISRGELVEIGGDFRVPDVLAQSGAALYEVGTTNRTTIGDYENAIGEATAMLLRVHPSNYKITGFTATPSLASLAELARRREIILYEDAGSGALIDLSAYGMSDEPVISASISAGVDIVSFSGDKLLGGPQAGIVVGRESLIEQLRKSPLYRALRVGKMIYAALEETLMAYARGAAETEIPVLRMITTSADDLAARTRAFAERLSAVITPDKQTKIEVLPGSSVVGGGAAPGVRQDASIVALRPERFSATALERRLRAGPQPVISRLSGGCVLIDLRTVEYDDEEALIEALVAAHKA